MAADHEDIGATENGGQRVVWHGPQKADTVGQARFRNEPLAQGSEQVVLPVDKGEVSFGHGIEGLGEAIDDRQRILLGHEVTHPEQLRLPPEAAMAARDLT
jgi:hypothetical protein